MARTVCRSDTARTLINLAKVVASETAIGKNQVLD